MRTITIFINFFKCADCNVKWIIRWNKKCHDDCPKCGFNVRSYRVDKLDIETNNRSIFTSWTLDDYMPHMFLCPSTSAKDKIFKNSRQGGII